MRYESEILYDLMKRDGLLNPSQDNLPYESELKEKYVDEVKGAYPKVTDYRPEWLNYNLGYYIPADFPTESLVNVTSGTVNNVVPYAFKSAILMGQTLVNKVQRITTTSSYTTIHNNGIGFTIDTNGETTTSRRSFTLLCTEITPGAKYTIIVDVAENTITRDGQQVLKIVLNNYSQANGGYVQVNVGETGLRVFEVTTPSDVTSENPYMETATVINGRFVVNGISIIEGHGHNLTDFIEGIQSVKMPVLTTTGKNLFDKNNYTEVSGSQFYSNVIGGENVATGSGDESHKWMVLKLPIGETYSVELDKRNTYHSNWTNSVVESDVNTILKGATYRTLVRETSDTTKISRHTFTTTKPYVFIHVGYDPKYSQNKQELLDSMMLNVGSNVATYEPYKSNILTVNEEVELRGIGDVKDTLDCLTGEIVSNFSTYSFSDVDNWKTNTEANCQRFTLRISPSPIGSDYSDKVCIISDKLPGVKWNQSWNTVNTISCNGDSISVQLPLGTTIEQFKELMRGSKIVYRIKSSIKTVDLTSVNQDGVPSTFRPFEGTMHVETDGELLKPLLDMEIPVEAITQNLASFVNLEGVERTVNENEEIVGDENNEQLL